MAHRQQFSFSKQSAFRLGESSVNQLLSIMADNGWEERDLFLNMLTYKKLLIKSC